MSHDSHARASQGFAEPSLLISPSALHSWLSAARSPLPLIIDMRPAEAFAMGHIEGAVHLDLWGVSLIDTSEAPLKAFLWIIEHQFALRGVTDDRPVIVCDETSNERAARGFWFLEYFGHPEVKMLDGGIAAWTRENLPLVRDATPPRPSEWKAHPRPERLATWRDVRERLNDPQVAMLDTRSDGEDPGSTVRAKRGGAIPGAVHVEWTNALDQHGAYRPAAELRAMYDAAGVTADRDVIVYCQGGYRAAHSYLTLRLLGYGNVRNYLGSWREWGDRDDLPLEKPAKA